MRLAEVTRRLEDLKALGFDAVQISPVQKSKDGHEWWARYQPQDYGTVEGLGSLAELGELCRRAEALGITIVADVVFNHMLVVASADEWRRSQTRPALLSELKRRLSQAVGPALDAEDFQWPWFELKGDHWDNENRYEGWGCGTWSELRHCPKVVGVHCRHLQLLLDAGVRGFRFDAVKHMRPAHLAEYVAYLRGAREDVYVYGEVLCFEEQTMHREYMEPLQMPTTDFPLLRAMERVLRPAPPPRAAGRGSEGPRAAVRPAAVAAVDSGAAGQTAAAEKPAVAAAPLALSEDSVRFARNHDTVLNDSFDKMSCFDARIIWAWLLALHDGSVLIFPQDLEDSASAPLLRRALRFRATTGACAEASEISLTVAAADKRPLMLTLVLRNRDGGIEGLCLLNLTRDRRLLVSSVPVTGDAETMLVPQDGGELLELAPGGALRGRGGGAAELALPPWDALFFLEAPLG